MANIDSFKSAFYGGGIRPNQFRIQLNFPLIDGTGATALTEFFCSGGSLPASTVGTIETYYRGRAVKTSGDRSFEPWTVTIINDNDFRIRNALENWSELMNKNRDNTGALEPAVYWQDLYVTQLDRNGNELKTYKMIGAFPENISAIDLSFDQLNTIETYTVTFQYQYWTTEGRMASNVL